MSRSTNTSAAVFILGALFFIFGFVTWLNGTLIPYLKIACELTTGQALWVPLVFYLAPFFFGLPSALVLERVGLKNGMMIGLFVMSIGALLFIPAANVRSYPLFLIGLFIIGSGLALLQTASNPYVTVVGPIESAAARISIMGICNKVAGVLAPMVLSSVVLADADQLVKDLSLLDAAAKSVRLDELAMRMLVTDPAWPTMWRSVVPHSSYLASGLGALLVVVVGKWLASRQNAAHATVELTSAGNETAREGDGK